MKRTFIAMLVFAAMLGGGTANAQDPSAAKSLLWRISGNGLAQPSYLFAMIDYICPADYLWTKNMGDAFAKCDKLATELNTSDTALKRELTPVILNRGGQTLQDYFETADYPTVKQYALDKLKLDFGKLQIVKPLAIQPSIIKELLECGYPESYQKRIISEAQKDGKKIVALENAGEVIDEIETTHFNEKIAAILTEMAKGSLYYHDYRSRVMAAYKQQDIQLIPTIFRGTKSFTPEDFRVILDEKSKRWADKMPNLMQQSSVFFALNVMNIGGSTGVINLLRKAGYTVDPVF